MIVINGNSKKIDLFDGIVETSINLLNRAKRSHYKKNSLYPKILSDSPFEDFLKLNYQIVKNN